MTTVKELVMAVTFCMLLRTEGQDSAQENLMGSRHALQCAHRESELQFWSLENNSDH